MSGFFGDLSPSQEAVLREFKEEFGAVDDHTALRFLRARQFDLKAAAVLYKKYVTYRKESGIDKILRSEVPKADLFKKFVPHAYHGFDKEGRPIYYEKTGAIDYGTAFQYLDDDDFMRHHLYQMELQVERCKEGSQRVGHVVDNFCSVIDLTGLNMSHRLALKLIRAYAGHDQDYYPERLGKLYIINAPWVFPTFWRMCKIWLDANTIKKIQVLGKNYKKELLKFIPAESLPEEYGGTCKCPGGCVHVADISNLKNGGGLDDELKAPDAHERTVAARDSHEVKLSCGPEGGRFDWVFKVQHERDINFSVEILAGALDWSLSTSSLEDLNDEVTHTVHKEKAKDHKRYITEPERVHSNKGSYVSSGATTILLKWENGYSYFTSKALRILTRVSAAAAENEEEKLPGVARIASPNNAGDHTAHMEAGVIDSAATAASGHSPREAALHAPAAVTAAATTAQPVN